MNSCIYEGKVRHRRNAPAHHEFDFRMFMMMLDLDELKTVFAKRWLWSTQRTAFARLRQNDRLTSHSHLTELRDRAIAVLNDSGISQPIGSIRLLTQLRYFGFEMNPVCFYYCYAKPEPDTEGQPQPIVAIIAEVNNTPWGEQHNYIIQATQDRSAANTGSQSNVRSSPIAKTFHVSPFLAMEMNYHMAFSIPGEKLGVKIENRITGSSSNQGDLGGENSTGHQQILDVVMLLQRRPLTGTNLNWMLVKYPLISFKTFVGIYWQALRLYLKKVPFYSHPKTSASKPTDEPKPLASDSEMPPSIASEAPFDPSVSEPSSSNSELVGQ